MSAVSPPRPRPAPGRLVAALVAGALAVTAPLLGASPAEAHEQLLSSSPAEGERLAVAPTELALEFTDEVMDLGAVLRLSDAAGAAWELGEPVLEGARVAASVESALPDGAYSLAWRVVSADGHPISGLVPFTVGDAEPASPGSDGSAGAAGSASTADDAADANADETADATQLADAAGDQGGMPPLLRTSLLAAGGAALALGIAGAVVLWRRRRTRG